MFNKKAKTPDATAKASGKTAGKQGKARELIPTIVTQDVHLLGNMVSEGTVDFSGTIDGNIRCDVLTLREQGTVKGEVTANSVYIQGTVKGLIRAKNVNLQATCKVEGIIIHEQLSIEDGAFVDGKFKRSDRVVPQETHSTDDSSDNSGEETFDASSFMRSGGNSNSTASQANAGGNVKVLENIRLIR